MDVAEWIRRAAEMVTADADRLTRLDAEIGDGDHGLNLARGFAAAVAALPEGAPPGKTLMAAGRAIVSKTGGASGPLYGTALRRAGKALGDAEIVDAEGLGAAVEGDKTMVDALIPAVAAYEAALPAGLAAATQAAAAAAAKGAEATIPLQARKGRASYLGPRSIGHKDPGAASTTLILRALAAVASA